MLSMRRMLVAAVMACAAFVSLSSAAAVAPAGMAPSQLAGTTGMPPFTIAAWRWIDIWQDDTAEYEAYVTNKQYHNVVRPLHTRATLPAPCHLVEQFPAPILMSVCLLFLLPVAGFKEWRPTARHLWRGAVPKVFVTTPRWKGTGGPSTLNVVDFEKMGRGGGPLLHPYPSLEMNKVGDPAQLQSVLGIEVDAFNRLWILDQGRVGDVAALAGSIKIVVWNVLAHKEVTRHVFPPHIAHPDTAFLNDLVLDAPRGFAYISDSGIPAQQSGAELHAGIIVYNMNAATEATRSWRLLSRHYSVQPEVGFSFSVNDRPVFENNPVQVGVDGIALTPDGLFLFYTPLSSRELYMVPTCLLRANASHEHVEAAVVHSLTKPGASGGITFAYGNGPAPIPLPPSEGASCHREELPHSSSNTEYELLITDLEHNSIWSYVGDLSRSNLNRTDNKVVIPSTVATDVHRLEWPDTFGFRHDGTLVVSSNSLNTFNDGSMNFETPASGANFRLEVIHAPILAPRFAYNSLPKNADVFTLFANPSEPCGGMSTTHHVVTNAEECLYTPHSGNSFRMSCVMNFTSGQVTANFAHYTGPFCSGTPTYSGGVHADGKTCTLLPGGDSATKSAHALCFNEPQELDEPAHGMHVYIGHGHVDTCDRGATSVRSVRHGVCTEIPEDGHFLLLECDYDRLATFSTHRTSACTKDDILTQGRGYGDGVSCMPVTSPWNSKVVLGSAAVLCGGVPLQPVDGGGGGHGARVSTGVAALLFFVGLSVGLIAMFFCVRWRNAKNVAPPSGYRVQRG